MTNAEPTQQPAPDDEQQRRLWSATEVRQDGEDRPEDESVKAMTAMLTEKIRREGYAIDHETITAGPWTPIHITPEPAIVWLDPDEVEAGLHIPDGEARHWRAAAVHRVSDGEDIDLVPTLIQYDVPEAVRQTGGEVRLRHNLADEDVTVIASHPEHGQKPPPSYMDLDGHQVTVSIHPGTEALYVLPGEPPTDE